MPRVLVVDDEPEIRRLVRRVLEAEGLEVEEAPDGQEAVEACHRRPPDLMVLDLIMPRKEGLETIREVKSDLPSLKIIAISGGGQGQPEGYLNLARHLGAERALAKPFLPMQLVQLVNELLEGSGAEA